MMDESSNVLNEIGGQPDAKPRVGMKRKLHVLFDTNQYQIDQEKRSENNSEDLYSTFNLVVRRKPEVNNFKAVLETIRGLINITSVNKYVPNWLYNIFLGIGNPKSAQYKNNIFSYSNLTDRITSFDFFDTFLSTDHVIETHSKQNVKFLSSERKEIKKELIKPPFKVEYTKDSTIFFPYTPLYKGPYFSTQQKENNVRFVTSQIEGIESGMNIGLTLIVGPPGTGKTDVAVQIISNIYHNFPNQKTLLVTHSNHALNDLFSKIMEKDIDERHLLRLGLGEKELDTDKDFSRFGRVNYTLYHRIELLKEVNRLSESIGIPVEGDHTCESSQYFYMYKYYII